MMKSTDEQLAEILKRSNEIKENVADRKRTALYITGVVACLCLMVLAGAYIPRLNNTASATGQVNYGSLILSASYIGYVVIGILAFALGVFVTLLCMHRMKKIDKK